jgi:hypothetical protein
MAPNARLRMAIHERSAYVQTTHAADALMLRRLTHAHGGDPSWEKPHRLSMDNPDITHQLTGYSKNQNKRTDARIACNQH